jgi:hypothetical protein
MNSLLNNLPRVKPTELEILLGMSEWEIRAHRAADVRIRQLEQELQQAQEKVLFWKEQTEVRERGLIARESELQQAREKLGLT